MPFAQTAVGETSSLPTAPPRLPPLEEAGRLAAVRAYHVLDTEPDARFDAITALGRRLLGVNSTIVSILDADRQWFKSACGDVRSGDQTPLDIAFCAHTIAAPQQPLIVPDALADSRFATNPLVLGPPHIRFYMGIPLRSPDDYVIGTLCVLDREPRRPSSADIAALSDLACCAAAVLELYRTNAELEDDRRHHGQLRDQHPQVPWTAAPDGKLIDIGKGLGRAMMRSAWSDHLHPDDRERVLDLWSRSLATGEPWDVEMRLRFADGGYRWLRCYATARHDDTGAIAQWFGTAQDITELRDQQAHADYLAFHDTLTGLPNRLRFRRLLDTQLGRRRGGAPIALLCLDLDQLGAINTTLGHHAGDEVLRLSARRLTACLRPGDILARTGGDAFSVIRPGRVTPADMATLCADLCATLADPFPIDGQPVAVGCSIGATVAPRDGADPELLLANAALALARAKAEGRGTFRSFEPSMDDSRRQQHALRIELYEALHRGELRLKYQPLVGLRSGRVEGFEALLRWHHPTRGEISPGEFIPMAEENGLIVAIGSWVLRQACRQAMTWPSDVAVSVNLSALQFTTTRDLLWTVAVALSEVGLAPHRLELEITESLPLLDNDHNLAVLRQLRALGVRIVLDDFGTGYASIGYLQRFEFDKLKIDRSIASRVNDNAKGRAILRAIVNMSHTLGIRTTAEGVETLDQLQTLRDDECDQVQGYVFSPAVPAWEVPALIETLRAPSLLLN